MQNRDVPAQCPYCKRVYANYQKVQTHIKKYCLKEKKYKCMFCAYRSKRRDHIIRHAGRVHESLVQEKVKAGIITGACDAFIDEGEDEVPGVDSGSKTLGTVNVPKLPSSLPSNVSLPTKSIMITNDGEESPEESDHDSDYDEDTIPNSDDI